MRSFLSSVRVVAAKEFRDCWRNLWLIVGSALFACLSLAVAFGTAAIGGDFSFRPLEAVMTSVVTLGVFLIPLIAVLISYDAFVGEQMISLQICAARSSWSLRTVENTQEMAAVPSVNPVDGLLMAEKIRKGVELQPFTWQQKTLYLTVSIGVGAIYAFDTLQITRDFELSGGIRLDNYHTEY